MFSKLTFVALISMAVAAPQHHTAAQYPAGVDPSKCPNFPICDNAVLHNQQPASSVNPAPSWNSQPAHQSQWNQPQPQSQWNHQTQPQQQWNQQQRQSQPQSQWPQTQSQWNQPQPQQQWNQPQPSWNSAPYQAPSNHLSNDQHSNDDLSGTGGDKYPAGVNPQSCPNYPYCDNAAGHDSPAAATPIKTGYISEREYPAGVSPHTCPNFPYCN